MFCKNWTRKKANSGAFSILGIRLNPVFSKYLSLEFCCFLSKRAYKDRALGVGPGKICLTWPWGGSLLLTWQTRQRYLQMPDGWKFLGYWVTFLSSAQYMSHLFQDRKVAAQMWRFWAENIKYCQDKMVSTKWIPYACGVRKYFN